MYRNSMMDRTSTTGMIVKTNSMLGKTSTVVEAIKQVWRTDKRARVLVAAPSNTAADLLASKLLEDVPREDILRLVSFRWLDKMDMKKEKGKGANISQGFYVLISRN